MFDHTLSQIIIHVKDSEEALFHKIKNALLCFLAAGTTLCTENDRVGEFYFLIIYNENKGWVRCTKCSKKMYTPLNADLDSSNVQLVHSCCNFRSDFEARGRKIENSDFNLNFRGSCDVDCLIKSQETQIVIFYDFECNREQQPIGVSLHICNENLEKFDEFGVISLVHDKLRQLFFIRNSEFLNSNWWSGPIGFFEARRNEFEMYIFNPDNEEMNVISFLFEIFFPSFVAAISDELLNRRTPMNHRVRTIEKFVITMVAHNGGRYDNLYFIRPCLNLMPNMTDDELSKIGILISNNSVISFECPLINETRWRTHIAINLRFRDSIKYIPSAKKALAAVSKELQLETGKQDFFIENIFIYCDILKRYLTEARLQGLQSHFSISEIGTYIESCAYQPMQSTYTLLKHQYEEAFDLEGNFNFAPANTRISNFHTRVSEYCNQDTKVLHQLIRKVFIEILRPRLYLATRTEADFFNLPTLSGIFYRNMFFDKLNTKILSQSIYIDQYCRKAVFGGRVTSSMIGQVRGTLENAKNEAEEKWLRQDVLNAAQRHINSYLSLQQFGISLLPSNAREDFSEDDIPLIEPQKQLFASNWKLFPLELKNLLNKSLIHLDICSQYPTAMTAPLPCGLACEVSQEQAQFLQGFFSRAVSTIVKNFGDIGYIHGIFCVELYRKTATVDIHHCNSHLIRFLPNLPSRQANGQLRWIASLAEPIYGYYTTYDLIQAKRDGWLIRFIRSLPPNYTCEAETQEDFNKISFGVVWNGSENILKSYMEKAFALKKQGAAEGNQGMYIIGKVIMNSGYGSTLFDSTKGHECHFQKLSPTNLVSWHENKATVRIINEDNGTYFVSHSPTFKMRDTCKRPSWIGAFILSCSRVMLWQLRDALSSSAAIYYVDTDSLTLPITEIVNLSRQSHITEGDEIGSFDDKNCKFNFNIKYETVDGGNGCKWWTQQSKGVFSQMPCIMGQVVVLAKKLYAEKCIFCEETRVRAKGFSREHLSFDFLFKMTEIFKFFKNRLSIQSPKSNAEQFFKYFIPHCFIEEKRTKYFEEHCVLNEAMCYCKLALEKKKELLGSFEPWGFFGFETCPKEFDLNCAITVDSLNVNYFSKNSEQAIFEAQACTIRRRIQVHPDTNNLHDLPCKHCNLFTHK